MLRNRFFARPTSLALLLPFLVLGLLAFRPAEDGTGNGLDVGDQVTQDFKLKNVDGSMVSMADFPDAKGFIVVFSCNHCPFVIKTEDRINALAKKYGKKGFPLLAINSNAPEIHPSDSYEEMVKRAEEKGFVFPYLVDETQEVAHYFGALKTPHVYVLSNQGEGTYRVEYVGAIDDNIHDPKNVETPYVENAVNALLNGQSPEVTKTKAVGCSIKYRS